MIGRRELSPNHWVASYQDATADEIREKLGADHVAWICAGGYRAPVLAQDGASVADVRAAAMFCADGLAMRQWRVPNLELMSAYERLAQLIARGEI